MIDRCSARNCIYNKQDRCFKKKTEINALHALSPLGTFCFSFISNNKKNDVIEKLEENQTTICDANNCKYNQDGICTTSIYINGYNANYRSETECRSFIRKDK